jgi:hypothetical protein
MRRPATIFLLSVFLAGSGGSSAVRALQDTSKGPAAPVRYTLEARLDAVNRLIIGRGRVSWRNASNHPTSELRFQMAWNAWRDSHSSWMRDEMLSGPDVFSERTDADAGFIDLTSLAIHDQAGSDLLAAAHYIAPDDRNGADRTVLAVPLASPVAPGDSIDLDFAWNAHVPRAVDRAGVIGDTFVITHWFPQLGVLRDDGWHCHQFRPGVATSGEFGQYDVALTVPATWVLGATGAEQAPSANADGTATHRYAAEHVQDFAWVTGPDFAVRTDRVNRADGSAIQLRLLLQPEHVDQADRQLAAVRVVIEAYERAIGRFPWPRLTVVDPVTVINPRAQGAGIGAAAYPMLIIGRTRWLTPWTTPVPEAALADEIGREYFSVDVAPDAVAHPWMDRGIAAVAFAHVMPRAFPTRFVTVDRYFGGLVAWPYTDVPWQKSTLAPGARWLDTLVAHVGDDTTTQLLSAYYSRAAGHHADPDTFLTAARAVTDHDIDWLADMLERPDVTVDYAVERVVSTPVDTSSTDTTVVVTRLADGVLPVDVRVSFADGSSVVERWDGQERSRTLTYRRGAPAVAVDVDPAHLLRAEWRRTNNSWVAKPSTAAAADKWSLRWMMWFQHVLMTYAFFA